MGVCYSSDDTPRWKYFRCDKYGKASYTDDLELADCYSSIKEAEIELQHSCLGFYKIEEVYHIV
jgi:hypothetical protein